MIDPHALECIVFDGIENAHGKTAKFGGYTVRFEWIDDPEIKNSYAVADAETGEWYTIVYSDDDKEEILSEIIDTLNGDNAKGMYATTHIGPLGGEWLHVYNLEKKFVMNNFRDLMRGHKLCSRDKNFAVIEHR